MHKKNLTTTGAVVSAIVASLCCIGPVAVALIGAGSIGAFAVFVSYRPYLIGLTAILLGLAFYLTYRRREVLCEDGTCKLESAGKWNKLTVWFAAVLAAGAIAFPYLELSPAAAQSINQNSEQGAMTLVELNIEGMDCEACAAGLQTTLGRIDGVARASVLFKEGKAVLEFDSTRVQPQKFIDRLDEVGFTATIKKEGKP
jgi:mercuric ion transport protein